MASSALAFCSVTMASETSPIPRDPSKDSLSLLWSREKERSLKKDPLPSIAVLRLFTVRWNQLCSIHNTIRSM